MSAGENSTDGLARISAVAGDSSDGDYALGRLPAGHSAGEMAERIRAFDWATTPLGPMDAWPQSLRTAVNILLSSRYQMWMAWGPELTFLCNDAYRPTLGIKHPWALGKRTSEVWKEIWPDIRPRIETVLNTGKATWDEGLLLFLERSGFREETYHTFSYSPLLDDEGRINGMLCVVTEETDRLIGERRVETLRDTASALSVANTEDEVLTALREALNRNTRDFPFTLTYFFDATGTARLASSRGIPKNHPMAVERIKSGSDSPWPARQVFVHPTSRPIRMLFEDEEVPPMPGLDWSDPARQAAIVPIRQQGQEHPAGFFVAGINPYRHYDAAYSGFVDLLCGQLAAGLGNARAWEAERRRAEALVEIDRAKTTFFSNISHELRTPLSLMLSPVEDLLASAGNDKTSTERSLLELVHRNGLRLQKLVNSLLDFSRIEAGRMHAVFEPLELGRFTAELAANFSSAMERAGLVYEIACDPLPEPVYVDRDMWEKIVLNLLSNAFKFTFFGTVRISLRSFEDHVELEVRDTGTGIPSSELPHIFERFHRVEGAQGRTIEGTGIGLALVQELVRLHAGTISAASTMGTGSAFLVSVPRGIAHLPVGSVSEGKRSGSQTAAIPGSRTEPFVQEALRWLPPGPAGQDEHPPDPVRATPRESILLADDNADMREYLIRLLGERFDIISVANGEEALSAALANPPDLILSDVMMPGLGGFELIAELRRYPETRTLPVILLSARAGEENRVEGFGAGADDYLIKPFTARELLARVSAHLSMKKRRENAESAVKEIQTTLQSFYDSSPFLMGIAELEGEDIIAAYFNRTMAEFFRVDAQTVAGIKISQLGVPPAVNRLWIEHYGRARATGSPARFEYEHPHASGNCWLSVVVNPLEAGSAHRPRFSIIAQDVTEERRARDLIRRSNEELRRANADLEQFAYSASHDLQEPLRQVAIYSQLIERKFGPKLEPKALEYLAYCVEGAQRMEMLVRDLLEYSQAGKTMADAGDPAGENQAVDVNQALETVGKNLATSIEETGALLKILPLPKVHAHVVPLIQLFQNLISNALKYRSDSVPEITVSAAWDGALWRFAVADNGIGIPAEFRTQVFGIFKRLHDRRSYPGNGIGLAICQKIVERCGGRIWVESQPGRGSVFFFTLPGEPAS